LALLKPRQRIPKEKFDFSPQGGPKIELLLLGQKHSKEKFQTGAHVRIRGGPIAPGNSSRGETKLLGSELEPAVLVRFEEGPLGGRYGARAHTIIRGF